MENFINVRSAGASGNGTSDDTDVIQKAFDNAGGAAVYIPDGDYRITRTLLVGSDTEIFAEKNARLFHCSSFPKKRGDFLLSNRNTVGGDSNIHIHGGIWDGSFDGKNNTKSHDLFDSGACSGALINLVNVKNLRLSDMDVINSVVYFIRMAKLDGFSIENICFRAKKRSFNQDGLHFGGECRNGKVRNIKGFDGETNDDMIALNADDSLERIENLDLVCGDIENIEFSDISSQSCYSLVRMLATEHAIRNITFKNLYGGCRMYAINMDGARYCKTPLFHEEDYPHGCGCIENIFFDTIRVFSDYSQSDQPLISAESVCKNFEIKNFERIKALEDTSDKRATILARNLSHTCLELSKEGKTHSFALNKKSDKIKIERDFEFDSLRIDAIQEVEEK